MLPFPSFLYRDAQAGGQPWSFAAGRVTQLMRRWSQLARRRRASLSPSSAEGGGALLLHRDVSPGSACRWRSSAYTMTFQNCGIGLFSARWNWMHQPVTWNNEKTLKADPRQDYCSDPVGEELNCQGQREGRGLISLIQPALVKSVADVLWLWRDCTVSLPRLVTGVSEWEKGDLYNIYFLNQYKVCDQRFPLYCWWGYTA